MGVAVGVDVDPVDRARVELRAGHRRGYRRRLRLIPASTWLPKRYHSVRMTATHSVRRDRGTG